MLDLTSSLYSLVVLCSTTLGLSTYVHNHYSGKFKEHQHRCRTGWLKRTESNKSFNFSEDTKKSIDSIENQKPISILKPIAFLASALPYAALCQAVNLANKYWGEWPFVTTLLVYTLLVWFMTTFGSTCFIIERLNKLRKDTDAIRAQVDSLLAVADAEYTGYFNNTSQQKNSPSQKPDPKTTPKVRTT